jgi:hypothetical protein
LAQFYSLFDLNPIYFKECFFSKIAQKFHFLAEKNSKEEGRSFNIYNWNQHFGFEK